MRRALGLAALALLAGCDNGGGSRTLGVDATGIVRGSVFFDANGSGLRDGAETAFTGATVRLLTPSGTDTVQVGATGADGSFRFAAVPVGAWIIELDSVSVGDTAVVAGARRLAISVVPRDSVVFDRAVSYPSRTLAQVRTAPIGQHVLVRGIALIARTTFSDTTVHVVDATGAMRSVRVRPSAVAAGDSVVLSARVAARLGQRVLDDVTIFVVSPTLVPTATAVTSAAAATGGTAGALDAALVRLTNVLVTDTATVNGDFRMTVTDGSGPAYVVLDRAADPGFRAPLPANVYIPGNRFDLLAVLVPDGAGAWSIKPRSALDLVRR